MVTANRNDGNNKRANFTFFGKSTDAKPTGSFQGTEIENGSAFLEIDTQNVAFYDAESNSWK